MRLIHPFLQNQILRTRPKIPKIPAFRTRAMASSSSCQIPQVPSSQPVFSSNYDPKQGAKDLEPLLKLDEGGNDGKWTLIASGKGLERSFKFKTFKKTWVSDFPYIDSLIVLRRNKANRTQQEFMNLIAPECGVQKHHPEWSNVRSHPIFPNLPFNYPSHCPHPPPYPI